MYRYRINLYKFTRSCLAELDTRLENPPVVEERDPNWRSEKFAEDKIKQHPKYMNPKESRVKEIAESCRIWSERWQKGAFNIIPAFIEREIART